MFTNLLAHGALGGWDEVIFAGVGIAFVVMMGISWIKSRSSEPILEEEPQPPTEAESTEHAPSHFKLD